MKSVGTVLYSPPCTRTVYPRNVGKGGAAAVLQTKTTEASMAEDRAPRSPPVFRTSSFHSGADWEAGRVGRPRNEEAPLGAELPSPLGRRSDAGLMRWAAPHGWAVGKISTQITASTPRLFKNFNFRCTWTDGWTNLLLKLDEYNGGPAAPYGSWVLLEKASPEAGPSEMQE